MGGYGSGRWGTAYVRKRRVEECLVLDVNVLAGSGLFAGGSTATGFLDWPNGNLVAFEIRPQGAHERVLGLRYCIRKGEEVLTDVEQPIILEARTHQRGRRWYLRCPCVRRVEKLYLSPGERCFLCRECHGLTYRSRQAHDKALDPYRRLAKCDPERLLASGYAGDLRALSVLCEALG